VEKRVPLALLLCFLAIVFFQMTPPPKPPVRDAADPAVQEALRDTGATDVPASELPADRVAATEERSEEVEFGREGTEGWYRATFSNRGARLLQLDLGNYRNSDESPLGKDSWVRLMQPVPGREGTTGSLAITAQPSAQSLFPEALDRVLWQMEVERDGPDGPARGVVFRYGPGGGWTLVKSVRPVPGTYDLKVEIGVERAADSTPFLGSIGLRITPAACIGIEFPDSFYQQPSAVAVGGVEGDYDAETERVEPKPKKVTGPLDVDLPIQAFGAHNKYFAAILRPLDETARQALTTVAYRRVEDTQLVADGERQSGAAFDYVVADGVVQFPAPEAGQSRILTFALYAGPKDENHFVSATAAHEAVLEEDLSTFSGIGRFLTYVLRKLDVLSGNWGVAIILLTLLIRLVLFPLNRRAQTAMARYAAKMKRIQPRLDELKKKYEDDAQKQRQEQAKIMQEEGAFPPLGGCLPIFLQLPIFFGLFSALRTSFDLRQAPFFGYITDLSRPDHLVPFGDALPVLGWTHFNLLPILMVILWIGQQKTMPTPTDENARRMQRIMMFMPIAMGVFLYNYAAGLSLYMMTQSTFGIIEQLVIKRLWPVDDTEPEKKKRSGCAPLANRMQQIAEEQQRRQAELKNRSGKGGAANAKRKKKR
jgi:YidC/Oxa1 family membrane protein insertase